MVKKCTTWRRWWTLWDTMVSLHICPSWFQKWPGNSIFLLVEHMTTVMSILMCSRLHCCLFRLPSWSLFWWQCNEIYLWPWWPDTSTWHIWMYRYKGEYAF
jgi:hypothetical protein